MSNICREGKYTRFFKAGEKGILTFIAKNNEDNYFKVLNMIREQNKNYNGYCCCEDKEEYNNFETIYYIFYNMHGKPVKGIYINFDFENNLVIAGNKKYKVKEDHEYTYKIQKTQIKATNGIKGFYKHIIESMHVDSVSNCSTYNIIESLYNK